MLPLKLGVLGTDFKGAKGVCPNVRLELGLKFGATILDRSQAKIPLCRNERRTVGAVVCHLLSLELEELALSA